MDGRLLFHGGTDDPYNFDGISYVSGQPSQPRADSLVYDASFDAFEREAPVATMDHRALAECGDAVFLVGGMVAGPQVTDDVWEL